VIAAATPVWRAPATASDEIGVVVVEPGRASGSAKTSSKTTMPFNELVSIAKDTGYDADLHAGLLRQHGQHGDYQLYEMSKQIKAAGLKVSHALPGQRQGINSDWELYDAARHTMSPISELPGILGCDMMRI